MRATFLLLQSLAVVQAACPFMTGELQKRNNDGKLPGDDGFLDQFKVDDANSFMTTDFGTPVDDRNSLKVGLTGPTMLEDFIYRKKLSHFDRERIPERVVHARGAAAHGYFESYADWSNITAASFLGGAGKQTPVFLRFSTVAGFRGSSDLARDVHGFALRFYTDAGNYDLVGNAIPVFFIQDAIQFPDLIHSVKPQPDREIPQAATAHDSAWDFFSANPTAMHTLLWALSGRGLPRSFRHMDGFGVNTYRFVTADGRSKLIKVHFTTKQGTASFTWQEAQAISGKNGDYHRSDLWNNIEAGNFPEWEMGVQLVDEENVRSMGFDLLDATKLIPVELVPITPLGKLVLNRNPTNYFAETEQSMFCPGNIVRGVDFSDDPLLQGRLFSYVDTHLHRALSSPNFEQLPINRPRSPVHNNNRDGPGQHKIFASQYPYVNNTLAGGAPFAANQSVGDGFFTAPARGVPTSHFLRQVSSTFSDVWSQPRMFYNSLPASEQQMVVNAARFELANVQSQQVRMNALMQFNRIDNCLANRVAAALGLPKLNPDPTFYHDNKTAGVSSFGNRPLPTVAGFEVGIMATVTNQDSLAQAKEIAAAVKGQGLVPVVIAESFTDGVDATYTNADGVLYDALVVADNTQSVFTTNSALYPLGRPNMIVRDAYYYGKPIGAVGGGKAGLDSIVTDPNQAGVYLVNSVSDLASKIVEGLKMWKFTDRFPMDAPC